jgi:cell fate (sporulation/competence/biofilm development) regulator YlbF (YheA/YmcA/DUF963 family)
LDAVTEKLQELVSAIRRTDEYRQFQKLNKEIESDAELSRRVNEFRRDNYQLQTSGQNLFDAVDELRERYADLFHNPVTNSLIESENSLCRLVRSIYMEISKAVEIESPVD